ncbi:carbohydrate ABC transporter permease [Clostridium sp. MB05]|jgi:multiple sugar transport system permease protein
MEGNIIVEESKLKNKYKKKIRRKRTNREKKEEKWFYIFVSPWILGFLFLTLGPIIASLAISLTDWDLFTKPNFVGLDNYIKLLTQDKIFRQVIYNTFYYAIISVVLNMAFSLLLAYLLSIKLRGIKFFRTIFYLPAVVPIVVSSMVFKWILAPDTGLLNKFLSIFGVNGPAWLLDPKWVKLSFVFLAVWGVGINMVLILSAMQGVSNDLYESASLDGAGEFRKFMSITVPMISPVIFFNLIMGIIKGLQAFSEIYIMTAGGPNNASNMMVPYLFDNAFKFYKMGYASSISWILFIIIIVFSLIVYKSSDLWVYYESEVKE